jgi:hypothetical protein
MDILDFFLICVFIGALYFFLIRNVQVFHFQTTISNAAHQNVIDWLDSLENDDELNRRRDEYEAKAKMLDRICNKLSYEKMLFSFRPLTLESWFDEKEIEFIEDGIQ